jgi:hexosaminidase
LGQEVIVWDEVFNSLFPQGLLPKTVIINTRFNARQKPARPPCVINATTNGYRVVRSRNKHWYLDQTVHMNWTVQYNFEPCMVDGVALNEYQCGNIIGGAASMWGETVDASDLLQTIWPRAAAVAERLWSPRATTSDPSAAAEPRYLRFRCYLNQLGFAAAPALNSNARAAPRGPDSCYTQ